MAIGWAGGGAAGSALARGVVHGAARVSDFGRESFRFHGPRRQIFVSLRLLWMVALGLIAGTRPVAAQSTEVHSFPNLNKVIPDGNATGLSEVEMVTSSIGDLTSLRVGLHVAGDFNGDLYGYLRHVCRGVTNFCVLLNRVGRSATNLAGYGDAGLDIVLDDAASNGDVHVYRSVTNLPAGCALTDTWQPDGRWVDPEMVLDTAPRTTALSSFRGTEGGGEWTLYLADVESGGTNVLVSWDLELGGIVAPTLTWPPPPDIPYGTALGSAQLNATASCAGTNVPGVFTYTPPPGTVLEPGQGQVVSVLFVPADANHFSSAAASVTVNVAPAPLAVTTVGQGILEIRGRGLSSQTFRLEFTAEVMKGDWQTVDTATAGADGVFVFTGSSRSAQGFYRTVSP